MFDLIAAIVRCKTDSVVLNAAVASYVNMQTVFVVRFS